MSTVWRTQTVQSKGVGGATLFSIAVFIRPIGFTATCWVCSSSGQLKLHDRL